MEMPHDEPAGSAPGTDAGANPPASESSVADELRELGERLAAALRAATATPEAESLKTEVGDGMRHLRREIDAALEGTPVANLRGEVTPAGALRGVRGEVAGALRAVNGALERLARSLEPSDRSGGGPDAPGGA